MKNLLRFETLIRIRTRRESSHQSSCFALLSTRFGVLSDIMRRRQVRPVGSIYLASLAKGQACGISLGKLMESCSFVVGLKQREDPALGAGAGPIADVSVQASESE
jgi:hypothetical protein